MENNFLAVNKNLFGRGLKSIDILIISQIEEFERYKCQCYITNEQFSKMFGESVSTIKRALDRLDDLKIIKRTTSFIEGNGRANKQRVLSINNHIEWKVQYEPTKEGMEGSNIDNGRFKSEQWKVHNEPIKDNLKDNLFIENANAKKEIESSKKLRELEELTDEELGNLLKRYRIKESYTNLQKDFHLAYGTLSKELPSKIDSILKERHKEEIEAKRDEEINRVLAQSAAFSDIDYDERFKMAQANRKKEEEKRKKEKKHNIFKEEKEDWVLMLEQEMDCTFDTM